MLAGTVYRGSAPAKNKMLNRIAIVTGGSRGLGRSISQQLSKLGAHVVMVYRKNKTEADAALKEIQDAGGSASLHQADISQAQEVETMISSVTDNHGRVDILVHSAFRSGRKPAKTHELDLEAWTDDLATNLTGAFLVSRACLKPMLEQTYGRIVFIGSLALRGERGRVAYTVAKNGVVGLSNTIAQEYARSGITSNVVSPGYLDAGAFLNLDPSIKEAAAKQVPQRRLGSAKEVAQSVAYFASEDAGYTTGQILNVNGGIFSG